MLRLNCLGENGLRWTIKKEDEKVLKQTLVNEIQDEEERAKVELV